MGFWALSAVGQKARYGRPGGTQPTSRLAGLLGFSNRKPGWEVYEEQDLPPLEAGEADSKVPALVRALWPSCHVAEERGPGGAGLSHPHPSLIHRQAGVLRLISS